MKPQVKLQEFVAETLKEIIAGVKEAQEYAGQQGATVNPHMRLAEATESGGVAVVQGVRLKEVEFDVAVVAEKAEETKGGVKVGIGLFNLATQGQSDSSSSSTSRVRFSVPIALPRQAIQKEDVIGDPRTPGDPRRGSSLASP